MNKNKTIYTIFIIIGLLMGLTLLGDILVENKIIIILCLFYITFVVSIFNKDISGEDEGAEIEAADTTRLRCRHPR